MVLRGYLFYPPGSHRLIVTIPLLYNVYMMTSRVQIMFPLDHKITVDVQTELPYNRGFIVGHTDA